MNDNNKKEVGFTPDDNNNIRLPGSVQPECNQGAGDWNFIKPHPLDAADTAGVVGIPTMSGDNMGQEGNLRPSLNSNVDMKNSDTTLMAPVGNSEENLSRKYKYPNVSQDVPVKGRPSVQYNDHS
jgi:hypothetical protein